MVVWVLSSIVPPFHLVRVEGEVGQLVFSWDMPYTRPDMGESACGCAFGRYHSDRVGLGALSIHLGLPRCLLLLLSDHYLSLDLTRRGLSLRLRSPIFIHDMFKKETTMDGTHTVTVRTAHVVLAARIIQVRSMS